MEGINEKVCLSLVPLTGMLFDLFIPNGILFTLSIYIYCLNWIHFCRLDVMDPAVLRPGRFGKSIYVPLPDADGRESILKAISRKKPIDSSVNFHAIARMNACKNLSGADLAALVSAVDSKIIL